MVVFAAYGFIEGVGGTQDKSFVSAEESTSNRNYA
jgi:hypothetical protein